MTYGLRVWDRSGAVRFDSVAHGGGVLGDVLVVPTSNRSGFKDYPQPHWAGRQVLLIADLWAAHTFSVSYPGGVPRVSWSLTADSLASLPPECRVLVFFR